MPSVAWQRLGDYLRETQLLGSIQSTLYWDQNTRMPQAGALWRGEQLALLARELHSRQSCNYFSCLLDEAKEELSRETKSGAFSSGESLQRSINLKLLDQDIQRQKRLDARLVSDLAQAKAEGYSCWHQAKDKNDFLLFAPALRKLIDLRKEQASQLKEPRSCWETLAQPFEPDVTFSRLEELFAPLRKRLPDLIDDVRAWGFRTGMKSWDLEPSIQKNLCGQLLLSWGRDDSISCVASSPHPFSITLGPSDFRLTTRIVPGQPLSCFFATAHEWGHSLYEQGLPSESHQWFAWPLGHATSMGVHESQSLFWENRVARSEAFSERWWRIFEEAGAPVRSTQDLWRLMNPLTPGLNRVEADELSYGLHIMIRTDLEIALLEKGLDVEAIPDEWNRRYFELLGLTPKSDSEGCLQDVHWSEGLFGYFPSYLLGHLISAQLSEAMNLDMKVEGFNSEDPLEERIALGEEDQLLSWLRSNVHHHGRSVNAECLVEKVTGRKLSSQPFLAYLEKKLDRLSSCS